MNSWADEFGARFYKLNDRDVRVWDEIISAEINHPKPQELLDAVRRIGEEKRLGKRRHNPTVEDLISVVKKLRWEQRQLLNQGPITENCAYCRNCGWMSYLDNHHYQYAIPCLCSRGDKELRREYKPEAWEPMREKSQKVFNWKQSIEPNAPFNILRFAPTPP